MTEEYVLPTNVEVEDWSDRLDEFPLYKTIEEIDWDTLKQLGTKYILNRHNLIRNDKFPYSICIFCEYLEKCNAILLALLKAKKILNCNLYKLRTNSLQDITDLQEIIRGDGKYGR